MLAAAPPPPAPCQVSVPLGPKHAVDPARHQQMLIAAGRSKRSSHTALTAWSWQGGCWVRQTRVHARNGARGWHHHPWDYSYYSPIGTFTLTDAGGRLAEPHRTKLPYHHAPRGFAMPWPSTHVFDYVVAVNFNRFPGRSPLDLSRPDLSIPDGGIWLHVSRGVATRGCIAMDRPQMRRLLQWLDPSADPVVVMGPRAELGH